MNAKELLAFLKPEGQQAIFDFIETAKRERGGLWLEELRAEYPLFDWIADLVLKQTGREALATIKAQYPILQLTAGFDEKLLNFHSELNRILRG